MPIVSSAVSLSLRPERAVVSPERRNVDVMIELKAAGLPGQQSGSASRVLAVVIDTSSSMDGGKLAVAKNFCERALVRTSAPHKLIVVTFADDASVVFTPDDDPITFRGHMALVQAQGMTALADGWRSGKLELGTFGGGDDERIKRIILITDGEANIGEKDPDVLEAWSARAAEEEQIATSTVGVGSDFNEELLSRMSISSGGNFWFSDETNLDAILDAELGHVSGTVVAAPRLLLELSPEVTVVEKLNALRLDGESVRLPSLSASTIMRYAWRLRVEGAPGTLHLVRVVLLSNGVPVADSTIELAVKNERDRVLAPVDAEVGAVVQRFEAARDQESARDHMRRGDLVGAVGAMGQARGVMARGPRSDDSDDVAIIETALRLVLALERTQGNGHADLSESKQMLRNLLSSAAFQVGHRGFRSETDREMIVATVGLVQQHARIVGSTDPGVVAAATELDELVRRST